MGFSPDGRRIVSGSRDQTVKVWDAQTGSETLTLRGHTGPVTSVTSFSPDGRRILPRDSLGMKILWEAESGKRIDNEPIPELSTRSTISPDGLLRVSSLGNNVLLIRKTPEYDELWAEDAARRKATASSYHSSQAKAAKDAGDLFAAEFHASQLLKLYAPSLNISTRHTIPGGSAPSWSPDGRHIVYARQALGSLSILDVESGETKELVAGGRDAFWSPVPNGPIAFLRKNNDPMNGDSVWVIRADGSGEHKVANGGWLSWSADGKTLYFIDTKTWKLMAAFVDKPESEPLVLAKDVGFYYPAVSPDGRCVAYRTGGPFFDPHARWQPTHSGNTIDGRFGPTRFLGGHGMERRWSSAATRKMGYGG